MTGELFIGTDDAYQKYGATLSGGNTNALMQPPTMKDYVENKSRLEHGKHVIVTNPKMDSRELTLTFGIKGKDAATFQTYRDAFIALLQSGEITLRVPSISSDTFHLIYTKSTSYAQNRTNTFCKIACKFIEADPSKRT